MEPPTPLTPTGDRGGGGGECTAARGAGGPASGRPAATALRARGLDDDLDVSIELSYLQDQDADMEYANDEA